MLEVVLKGRVRWIHFVPFLPCVGYYHNTPDLVSDLIGARHGTTSSKSMAHKVVNEIRAAGGTAVANYVSVMYLVRQDHEDGN